MEQKRTLWIIAASGVFLLVVVGAALILYSPSLHNNQAQQAAFNPADGWTTPAYTTTTYPSEIPATGTTDAFAQNNINVPDFSGDSPAPASPFDLPAVAQSEVPANSIKTDNLTVYSDNTTVYGSGTTTIDLNTLKSTPATNVATKPANETTTKQIASTNTAKSEAAPRYTYEEPKKAPVAKAAPAKTTAKSTASAAPAKKAVATAKVPDRFWVQAASYATKKNADDARATLENNKIPSEVFTYTDSKGKVFYRVRIGPYTTSSEAEYWKTQVAKIDQFADVQSYIVNSSAKAVR
ncbi:MAG: SPOR domain-containing protein [Treponema sp.]|nr:SPOR domain-containing protein [Treponema sp.]